MALRPWVRAASLLPLLALMPAEAEAVRQISEQQFRAGVDAADLDVAVAVPASRTAWRAAYQTAGDLSSGIEGVSAQPAVEGRARLSEMARTGGYSIQQELRKSDPDKGGSKRCESDDMDQMGTRIARGSTKYYGFSVYFVSSWEFNPGKYSDIVFQWKGFSGDPFMTLQQKYEGLYLRVQAGNRQFIVAADGLRGRWHDVRAKVRWETNASGRVELEYKTHRDANYSTVVDFQGETMDRDVGGYLKWGLYRPDWKITPSATAFSVRNIWHDNVAVGDSWEAVDPARPP